MVWTNNANNIFEDENVFESLEIGDVVNFNGQLTKVVDKKYDLFLNDKQRYENYRLFY